MSKKHILFIHGFTASSRADWYPAISPLLKEQGINYSIPDMPNSSRPKSAAWIEAIRAHVRKIDKPIILVGHSLGTRAVLLYLEQYKESVDSVLLIAPLSNNIENAKRREDTEGNYGYPDFFKHKIDVSIVKPLAKHWKIMHSTDDSSLEYQTHGVSLATELQVELLTYDGRDHFSAPENAPLILSIVEELQTS